MSFIKGSEIHDGHLGGFIHGGNECTYAPALWNYLINYYNIKTMIDVGCGEGHAIKFFLDRGVNAKGVEGSPYALEHCPIDKSLIKINDYQKQELIVHEKIDLIWSCEFVEHVEEQCTENFLKTFDCGQYIAMTAAPVGQPGWHHVNCKDKEYWIELLQKRGFKYNDTETNRMKQIQFDKANTSNGYHVWKDLLFFSKV